MFKIRCKIISHIGFLVEACVEAVPQSVLQLVAMQHTGQANGLSVLSIVLSICCLASKGYVASFSIHFRTFVFSGMCIAADVLNMFATAAWLSSPAVLTSTATAACACWVRLGCLTAALIGATGLSMVVKVHSEVYWEAWSDLVRSLGLSLVFLQRPATDLAWDMLCGSGIISLGVFPALVMMLSVKLALIPVGALRSLDDGSARNQHRALFDWIMARDQDLRMHCTISALLPCAVSMQSGLSGSTFIHCLAAREKPDLRSLMAEGDLTTQQLRVAAKQENRANLAVMLSEMVSGMKEAGKEMIPDFKAYLQGPEAGGTPRQRKVITAANVSTGIFGTLSVLSFATFVLISAMLPVVCVVSHVLHGMYEDHLLETVLSCLYLGLLGGMACLAPSVVQFEIFSDILSPLLFAYEGPAETFLRRGWHPVELAKDSINLRTIKKSYWGWIMGCQIQAGLVSKFGNGIPDLIHLAGKSQSKSTNERPIPIVLHCLLYTSDAADEEDSVDLGGRRILNKKTTVILS
eukprot:TRINITY_DN1191_c0_g1_i15.p1 TRINITY_DN1191_c0_g1~~TRINITY_DN1191_c0_g1_i15.p1  ORF type:complete len:521 (-),score=95.54 TRINITY_DN1191_c0_g1_i15:72-1634(-)